MGEGLRPPQVLRRQVLNRPRPSAGTAAQSSDAGADSSQQRADMLGQHSFQNLLAELPSEEAGVDIIAAGDLIEEYKADSEAALAKYTDSTLTISGIVEKKGRDFRNFSPYLDINGEVTSETHQIRCNMQTISERRPATRRTGRRPHGAFQRR